MRTTQSLLSWRSFSSKNIHLPLPFRAPASFFSAAVLLLLFYGPSNAFAGSATWKASPATGDWNTAANWTPNTVPNGPSDTATFASSNKTGVSISANTEVNTIVFNAGASAFTITVSPTNSQLTISGVGITNNSGIAQNFAITSQVPPVAAIVFTNSATAGSGTFFTTNSGFVAFNDASTAGNGTFTTSGGVASGADGGDMVFSNSATAGNGTFTINGGAVRGACGGSTEFYYNSSAGNGTFTINGGAVRGACGGSTYFFYNSTADNATLIANGGQHGGTGGTIDFQNNSRGGRARVKVFGDGSLDTSYNHLFPGVTIGSIEGTGAVLFGTNTLTVGSNNLDTTFSGVIQGGPGSNSASLTKIGEGKLILTGANTYESTGATIVNDGKLLVNNTSGSGTGSGPVQVNDDGLGGTGTIAGAVTVGTGSGAGAFLAPGKGAKPGILTINSTLTFNSQSTCKVDFDSSSPAADKVICNGVIINSGAQFSFIDHGTGTITPGTIFTVIENTSASPIAGTFSNFPDNSTFTNNGNTYKVSYEGGTGNDLTLTVQ
jgi:autotransporter-associated beta strand protein